MEPLLGEITLFGFNFAPRGWAECNGQILPINQNQSLYSLLGTTYGGDGRTTFALPDLRGRVPIGFGNGPGLTDRNLGDRSGSETVVLTTQEMPSHLHTAVSETQTSVEVSNTNGAESVAAGQFIANHQGAFAEEGTVGTSLGGIVSPSTTTLLNTGGGQAHNNMQPYLAVNHCIAIQGIFPSRN